MLTIIPETGMYLGLSGAGTRLKPHTVPENAVFLNQVHGSRIVHDPAGGESADGMVLKRGFGTPALKVADCLPLFAIWDDWIGAAHAGWRGLANGIVENLIAAVDQPLRWLVMGPSICGDCYVAGEKTREAVFQRDPSGGEKHPPGRIDLRGSATRIARSMCGEHFQFVSMDECTLESKSLYSFRRNKTSERNFLWLAETERYEHIRQLNMNTSVNSDTEY